MLFNYEIVRISNHIFFIQSLLIDIILYITDNFKYSFNKSSELLRGGRIKRSLVTTKNKFLL